MQELSYSNNIHINNKFEPVLTEILYYKRNKYYPYLTVKKLHLGVPQSCPVFQSRTRMSA